MFRVDVSWNMYFKLCGAFPDEMSFNDICKSINAEYVKNPVQSYLSFQNESDYVMFIMRYL